MNTIDIWAAFLAATTNTPVAGGTWEFTSGATTSIGSTGTTFPQASPNNVTFSNPGLYKFEYTVCDPTNTSCCSTTEFELCLPDLDVYTVPVVEQCDFKLIYANPDTGVQDNIIVRPLGGIGTSTERLEYYFDTIVEISCPSTGVTTTNEGTFTVSANYSGTEGTGPVSLSSGWSDFGGFTLVDPVITVVLNTAGSGNVEVFADDYWRNVLFQTTPLDNYADLNSAVTGALSAGGAYTSTGVAYTQGANTSGGAYHTHQIQSNSGLLFGIWNSPSGVWLGLNSNSPTLGYLNIDTTGDGVGDTQEPPNVHYGDNIIFEGFDTYPDPPYTPPSAYANCSTLQTTGGIFPNYIPYGDTILNLDLTNHTVISSANADTVPVAGFTYPTDPNEFGMFESPSTLYNIDMTCDLMAEELNVDAISGGCCGLVDQSSNFWTGPNGFTSTLPNPIVSDPGTYTVSTIILECEAGQFTGNNDQDIACSGSITI